MTATRSDVLVLGGGVIGLSCALALLKQGRSVTVLERGTAGSGASRGNCGTITPSLLPLPAPGVIRQALKWMTTADAPLLVRPTLDPARLGWLLRFAAHSSPSKFSNALKHKIPLLLRSRRLLEQLIAEEQLDCEFEPAGHLQVFRDAREFERARLRMDAAAEYGLVTEALDARALHAREPALNDSVIGGLFNPGDAHLRPDRYMAALTQAVRKHGGQIIENASIIGVRTEGTRVASVQAGGAEYQGREVLLALGAWSPELAKQLQLNLPLQPGKGYSLTYSRPQLAPRIPLILMERRICVTTWGSGFRLGSTMEFAGYDETLNPARLAALRRGAPEYLRDYQSGELYEEWYGWRPMTWDDLPIIGRAPRHDNLWLATGHGMLGITLSAVTAELIRDLLTGCKPSMDVTPFSPLRFGA